MHLTEKMCHVAYIYEQKMFFYTSQIHCQLLKFDLKFNIARPSCLHVLITALKYYLNYTYKVPIFLSVLRLLRPLWKHVLCAKE